MEKLLNQITKSIIGSDKFKIDKMEEAGGVILHLKIPSEFMGLIIGKEGKTIKAIRTLLKIRATLEKTRVDLNVEPLD